MFVSNLPVRNPQDLDLIVTALQREKKILEWEIEKTRKRLEEFERKLALSSDSFYKKYQAGEMGDDETTMAWAGEYQFYLRFTEKHSHLEELILECQKLMTT